MHPYQGRPCTVCGKVYISFAQHIRQHPRCALPVVTKSEEVPPQASARTASDEILEELRAMMASDLADLRYQNGLDESMIGALKRKVTHWNEEMAKIVMKIVMPLLLPSADPEQVKECLAIDIFDRLVTHKQEMAYAKINTPYIEPRITNLGAKKCDVGSFDVASLLTRKLI